MLAIAPARNLPIETGVDDDCACFIANEPDEIIERHLAIMVITPNEIFGASGMGVMGVA